MFCRRRVCRLQIWPVPASSAFHEGIHVQSKSHSGGQITGHSGICPLWLYCSNDIWSPISRSCAHELLEAAYRLQIWPVPAPSAFREGIHILSKSPSERQISRHIRHDPVMSILFSFDRLKFQLEAHNQAWQEERLNCIYREA